MISSLSISLITLNKDTNKPQYITFYKNGLKYKTIDIKGRKHKINGTWYRTHVHLGENHEENGTRPLNKRELKFVAKILKM